MRRMLMGCAAVALLCGGGAATVEAQERTVRQDLEYMGRDAWHIVTAPAHATAADLRTGALVVAGFGALLLVDEPIHEWLRANPESLPVRIAGPVREASLISLTGRTRQFLVPLSLALYGAGHAFDSERLRDAGLGCATSNVTTTLTRSFLSLLLGRLRPRYDRGAFVFEPFAFGGWEMRSFPGGHAANIMSCASFFSNRFDMGLAEPAMYALAVGVGGARVIDEAHWASDSFFGMAYGYAVGRGVAARFTRRHAEREAERSVQPGITIGWTITF